MLFRVLAVASAFAGVNFGQTATRVVGEVTGLVSASGQIALKNDRGEVVTVLVNDSTVFRKVPPSAQDLTAATRIDFSAVSVGDRVLAVGQSSGDAARLEARSIIVMTRSDLNQKRRAEHENWQKRGISGTVSGINPDGKTFTVKSGSRNLTIRPAANAQYHRYAADSVKFSDARPSSLAEIRIGDQVRVLGARSGDGTTVAAERVVSGTFQQFAATISALSANAGEIVVRDLATKKTVTVGVNPGSTMKRLPPAVAASLAQRYRPGGEKAAGGEDFGQILDRLPTIALSDLKPGDAIMLSGAAGSDPARLTAFMLLAGVEPLLAASPSSTRDIMSGWNLGSVEGGPQ